MKILFIERNVALREYLSHSVRVACHEVIGVEKLSHATEELSAWHCDLVICRDTVEPGCFKDGVRYAEMLVRQGFKVKILTAGDLDHIPKGMPYYDLSGETPNWARISDLWKI